MICNFTPISGKQFMSLALDVTAWWNTIVSSVLAFMIVSWIVMIERRTIFLLAYHSWEPGRKAKDYLHIRKDKFFLHGGKYTWLGKSKKKPQHFLRPLFRPHEAPSPLSTGVGVTSQSRTSTHSLGGFQVGFLLYSRFVWRLYMHYS